MYNIVFEETFRSPCVHVTQQEAQKTLEAIRDHHPANLGWVEVTGYCYQDPFTKFWGAVRQHYKLAL